MSSKLGEKVYAGAEKIKQTVSDVVTDVRLHWNKPAKGNYISYKEIGAYSVGGMGVNMIAFFVGYLGFNTSSLLLASTIGIRPLHIQTMMTVKTILDLFFFALRGKLVDNTRTKWGRFRPYIAVMGVPLVVLTLVYLFLDFDTMSYIEKLIATFAFGIAVAMLSPLLTDTHGELGSCLSPNTAERTKMFTIYSIVFSIAPTVYNFLIPIISNATGGYTNIDTYRYIIAPVGIMGLGLTLFAAFGCKERVVTSQDFVFKTGMLQGCVAVWKNKDWWIRTVSGFVGFLEGANGVLLNWIYIYDTQDMVTYSFLVTIMGSASFVAMVLCPFLLSKMGNRKLLLFHNFFNILLVACMMASYKVPLLFFLFTYINTAINNLSMVYNPVMAAEVKDSIQYQSGLRLDFTLGAAGMIALPITVTTGYVIPFVYESMGLAMDYNVLYDPLIRNNLFYVLCAMSVLGAALNLIPFFFYDLSREKHRVIIAALKYRAANEDLAAGKLTAAEIKETVELYDEMTGYAMAEQPDMKALKNELKSARGMKFGGTGDKESFKAERRNAIKEAKGKIVAAEKLKDYKDAVQKIFMQELHKFEAPVFAAKVAMAKKVAGCPIGELDSVGRLQAETDGSEVDEKTLRKIRSVEKKMNAALIKTVKKAAKTYHDGTPADLKGEFDRALSDLSQAGTGKNRKEARKVVLRAKRAYMKYHSVYKFRFECEKLQADADAGKHWERIRDMYPQACEETDLLNKLETEKERAERAAHIAEIELAKAKRKFDKASRAAKGKGDGAVGRFDPSDFGLSEQGYALRKTGDELQSLLDRNKAARALAKARRQFEKTSARSAGERFDPAAYGLDGQGYPLSENKEEDKQ